MNVLSILTDAGVLKAEEATAIAEESRTTQTPVTTILEKRGITSEQILAKESERFGIPVRAVPNSARGREILDRIPEESARHYGFVPLSVVDGALEVGIIDPDNIEALDALQFISSRVGLPYKLFLISQVDFDRVLEEYGSLSEEVGTALSELEPAAETEESKGKDGEVETVIKEDAPVTKIVATILRYAVEGGASDIHIEPTIEKTHVRFRMDGDLHTSLELPVKVHPAVVARIKILSQMRLDEKRKPQDGRFSAQVEGRRIDFRVSTFPTQGGEKVVMRILDRSKSVATLESLGFSAQDFATIKESLDRPYGIILISGPTGSGKSTTLFAMLSAIDRETQNVVSLEDPVEYEVPGVAQSQVHPEIGYTFASGLRSILRQDPDVIMVGEIRDKETAQLAIQAALTGHLVFSTIHTNTAAGVIPRLVDMGVDPYLIAPTLIAAIGQRLVRKLCPGAGVPQPISPSIKLLLEKEFSDMPAEFRQNLPAFDTYYEATTTPDCPNGTRGRLAVFEILRMDKDLERVVLEDPVEEKVYAAARAKGMFTMREDAIMKALAGQIPFEEVNTLGGALLAESEPETEENPEAAAAEAS
ncbi:MAG: type IV pilus assembly protein PilB [Parcubacteria bacterium C7867-007]|nr:MAG: type IV pilus assembly protein PilB [Parcubacteria bacterium C7867-007]